MSETLREVLEAHGKTQRDLSKLIGSKSRASELLAGKRHATRSQTLLIVQHWGVPLERVFFAEIEPK